MKLRIVIIILSLGWMSPAHAKDNQPLLPELQAPNLSTPANSFEIYSETSYRPDYDSLVTDSRLRYLIPLLHNLKAYLGANIERELQSDPKLLFIQNAISPQVGLLYQPLSYLNFWAEHRQRFIEGPNKSYQESVADPRLGISSGTFLDHSPYFFEAYGEAVLVPRLSSGGILSGYLRPFVRSSVNSFVNADLYGELNGYSSPTADLGPSRIQLRSGGRLQFSGSPLQASLLVYKPWTLSSQSSYESDIEALLVLGAYF